MSMYTCMICPVPQACPYDAMSICLLSSISKCIPLGYAHLIGEETQLHSPHYFYTKVSRY